MGRSTLYANAIGIQATGGAGFNNGNSASFAGGGQVGGNYQIGSFVVGAEADFDWFANNNNSGNGTTVPGGTILRASANDRWETTLAARFGYAWDHALFYGKAGGGWVGAGNFAVTNVGTGASVTVSNGNTNVGWLVGAGFEYAFTQNWTAKLEYDYLALNNASYTVTVPGCRRRHFHKWRSQRPDVHCRGQLSVRHELISEF